MTAWRDANDRGDPVCPGCGARRPADDTPCPACGMSSARRDEPHVRDRDLEPYTALLYIGRLFKVLSVLIVLAMVGELVLGVILEGSSSLGTFLGEAMRLVALAGLLWAGGDIVRLIIAVGHDLRVSRILLGRISTRFQSPSSAPSAPVSSERDGRRAS
jgi:hypothetical protein